MKYTIRKQEKDNKPLIGNDMVIRTRKRSFLLRILSKINELCERRDQKEYPYPLVD